MSSASSARVTRLLSNWRNGSESARNELIPVVHDKLRRIVRRHLRREHPDHTLQSGGLANEAGLRRKVNRSFQA